MALTRRIIPCLDLKDGRVVKGTHFIDLRDAGDPVELAQLYNEQGADEVVFLDITASKENRGTMLEVIGRSADQLFLPLTVGGGIRKGLGSVRGNQGQVQGHRDCYECPWQSSQLRLYNVKNELGLRKTCDFRQYL